MSKARLVSQTPDSKQDILVSGSNIKTVGGQSVLGPGDIPVSVDLTSPGPIGNISPSTVGATSITDSGNLTFTGTGNRITGDFSNATFANRVMFQTSTVNASTSISVIPNGTSSVAVLRVHNSSDANNSSEVNIAALATDVRIQSQALGTGTYLPMTFYTNGNERMRIDTSGNVGIGAGISSGRFNVAGGRSFFGANSDEYPIGVGFTQARVNSGQVFYIGATDSATPALRLSNAAGLVRLEVDDVGNVLSRGAGGGLGYGTGAGGTVTQATSRNTAVAAINKPTGAITLFSAAGSVTPFTFTVPNSLVVVNDVITLSVRSGANKYIVFVSSIAAGSFDITGYALSGTATEAPIINFAVIKGASI